MTVATKAKAATAATNGHAPTKVTIKEIPVGDLVRLEVVQRPLIEAWVRKLARDMDLDALGTFVVSLRENGKHVLLDGGHRQAALLELGMDDWPVRCVVYHGLDVPTEAGLFRRLNNNRKVSALEDFLKGVTEGDGECVVINRICKKAGLTVDRNVGPGKITCVSALRRVYVGRGAKVHPDELREALLTATEAWGHTPEAVEGKVIHGLGEFFKRHGADVDRADLVKKLAKVPGGPSRMVGNALNLNEMTSRPVYRCVVEVVVGIYNKGRRKSALAAA